MINQGFVTDSDTEKELKKWQQARTTAVNEENEIMLITTEGIIIQMRVDEISVLGRITSGVKLIDLDPDKDIVVATMAKVRDSQPSDAKDSFLEEMENEMRQNEEEADNDIEEADDTDNPQE